MSRARQARDLFLTGIGQPGLLGLSFSAFGAARIITGTRLNWFPYRDLGRSMANRVTACCRRSLMIAAALTVAGPLPAVSQEAPQAGLATLLRVRLPLTGNADQALRNSLGRARDRLVAAARAQQDPRRPVLVLEITPAPGAPGAGAGSQFERVLSLAQFLVSGAMTDVKTVAYVPQTIRGHGVLLTIACEELMMAADAELGDASAGVDGRQQEASQTVVAAYREIADARRTFPEALAVGMVDASTEVLQVDSEVGTRFLLDRDLEDFAAEHDVIDQQTLAPRGTAARFTGRQGRKLGFVRLLADGRSEVARSLNVPAEALREDQSLLAEWNPIILEVKGPLTPQLASELETSLGNELKRGVNWICFRIDSSGGDLAASISLATIVAELDANSVRTVAYVPMEARGGAALVALACDQIATHADARLGAGPPAAALDNEPPPERRLPPPGQNLPPQLRRWADPQDRSAEELAAATTSVRQSLAPRAEQPWSLLTATIDPSIELFEYRNRATGQLRVMNEEEAAALADAEDWNRGAALQDDDGNASFTGAVGQRLGVVWQVVESFDELKQLFGIEQEPPLIEANWAQRLVQALAAPWFATMLVMIGFVGVYVELKSPGVGIGGFIAAVAFALFFWSKALDQTAGWLEIVLFLTGLFFILMEVFVLPGFGIFGLGGGALMLLSLVLASQTFVIPRTESDLSELRRSMTVVVAAGIGVIAMAFAMRRFLPHAPLFNRIILEPPRPEERIAVESRESIVDYAYLLGKSGTTVTDLRPSGKAQIGDEMIDVIAEAEPLDRGTAVVVVDAHANRVVVRGVG